MATGDFAALVVGEGFHALAALDFATAADGAAEDGDGHGVGALGLGGVWTEWWGVWFVRFGGTAGDVENHQRPPVTRTGD